MAELTLHWSQQAASVVILWISSYNCHLNEQAAHVRDLHMNTHMYEVIAFMNSP
jgi:hypothetical protein